MTARGRVQTLPPMVQRSECFVKEGTNMDILIFTGIYIAVYVMIRGTIRAIVKK